MSLESKEYYINRPDGGWIITGGRHCLEFSQRATHTHASVLHSFQMRPASDQRDILAGPCEHRSNESPYRTRTDNRESH